MLRRHAHLRSRGSEGRECTRRAGYWTIRDLQNPESQFPKQDRSGRFVALASGKKEDEDALPIRADARVLGATLKAGETEYTLDEGRRAYLVPSTGIVEVNGVRLTQRDGAAVQNERRLKVTALEDAEIVLVDVA